MSNEIVPSEVVPVWTPQDHQPRRCLEDQAEFEADLAYLRGLATAILEYSSPQALMRIAAFDGDKS